MVQKLSLRGALRKRCCENKMQQIYRRASKGKCDFNKIGKQGHLFDKKVVLKNVVKFIGKHLCQSFFFNIVAGRDLQQY